MVRRFKDQPYSWKAMLKMVKLDIKKLKDAAKGK